VISSFPSTFQAWRPPTSTRTFRYSSACNRVAAAGARFAPLSSVTTMRTLPRGSSRAARSSISLNGSPTATEIWPEAYRSPSRTSTTAISSASSTSRLNCSGVMLCRRFVSNQPCQASGFEVQAMFASGCGPAPPCGTGRGGPVRSVVCTVVRIVLAAPRAWLGPRTVPARTRTRRDRVAAEREGFPQRQPPVAHDRDASSFRNTSRSGLRRVK
jgi:hypothetical protein